jgi:hypothetical protein
LPHPLCPRAQPLHQLASVLLNMADRVELQLQLVERQPVKARRSFQVQLGYPLLNLWLTEGQVFEHVVLVTGLTNLRRRIWRPRYLADELIFISMLGPRREGLPRVLQIEMRIEQRMAGNVPGLGLVARSIPDGLGAFGDRLLEHFESRLVLGKTYSVPHAMSFSMPIVVRFGIGKR